MKNKKSSTNLLTPINSTRLRIPPSLLWVNGWISYTREQPKPLHHLCFFTSSIARVIYIRRLEIGHGRGEARLIIWEYGVGNTHVSELCGIAIYSIYIERKRRSFMMPVVPTAKYQGVPFLPAADFSKVLAWCIRCGGVDLSLLSALKTK